MKQLCRILDPMISEARVMDLTIYNNNVTDDGAFALLEAMKINKSLQMVNLQMNFIKDRTGRIFIDGLKKNYY